MTIAVLYRTLLRGCSTRARIVGFLAVAAVEIVVAALLAGAGLSDARGAAVQIVDKFGLVLVIPLASLVFGTASLGDPIEDGTYVYLWLRPIRRVTITVAAYAATLSMVVPLAVVPTVVAGMIVDPSGQIFAGAVVSSMLAAVAYAAVFVLMGQVTNRALIWGVAYLLILEQFIARGGTGLGFISVHSHAVSVLSRFAGRDIDLSYFSATTGIVVPLVIAALLLGFSSSRQRHMSVA